MAIAALRARIAQNPALGAGVAAGLIVLALLLAWFIRRGAAVSVPAHPPIKMFFVDESTGKEIGVKTSYDVPPLPNDSGQPTIVEAIYYTRDGGASRTLAYYQKYSDAGKEAFLKIQKDPTAQGDSGLMKELNDGTLIRSPEQGAQWVPMGSPEATMISAKAVNACRGNGPLQVVKAE